MPRFLLDFAAWFGKSSIRRGRRIQLAALLLPLALVLSSCTLLPIKNLQPVIAPPAGACADLKDIPRLSNETRTPSTIQYLYPDLKGWTPHGGPRPVASAANFADFSTQIEDNLKAQLPLELVNHPVAVALRKLFTAVSAESQLDAQVAVNRAMLDARVPGVVKFDAKTVDDERDAIKKFNTAPKLKQKELKDFATKLFNLQLKHGPADFMGQEADKVALSKQEGSRADARPKLTTAFVAYLKAYYENKFYDRMGALVSKPTLPSLSSPSSFSNVAIPDSEIVNAETVMIEFMLDWIDPTPIMGNNSDPTKATIFWPGASANEPTALITGVAGYVGLPSTKGCGINQTNVWVLTDLANAAGDEAANVGGLIANSAGGFSFGLGAEFKLSVGDNQTLSDLVKTADSELALRITLSTSYFTLRNVDFNPPDV